jgi:Zn-dependent protease
LVTDLEEIARQARQLTALGQLQAARDHWVAALSLLPADSPQRRAVQNEIEKLDRRLAPQPAVDWKKRLGPVGVGVAALAKYKTFLFVLLAKGKFLISALAYLGLYWAMYGWWFAVGLTGSVFLHEMGHYLVARRFGFAAELPMFIPGFGAYVKWNGAGVDPNVRAQISLAGPLFGFLSGLISYGIYLSNGHAIWLGVAQFAGMINLLNLIPVSLGIVNLDGLPAMLALGLQGRMAVLLVSVALFFMLGGYLFLAVAAATAYRIWKHDFPAEPKQGIAYYFIVVMVANGFLSWFASNQVQLAFPR